MTSLRCGRPLRRHRRELESNDDIIGQKRRRTEVEKRKKINDLPTALLFDILSRLPLTCLLKNAKFTCKLWHVMITDPMFSESHLVHSLQNPGHLYRFKNDSNIYFADDSIEHATGGGMQLPGDLGNNKYEDFVSCNGLMCYHVADEKAIYICNPIIGDHVKVDTPKSDYRISWGFGYAPLSKKYKYIQFSAQKQPKLQMTGVVVTLGDKSWRELTIPFLEFCRWQRSPAYCNGALYWAIMQFMKEEVLEYNVLSFDLETEKTRARRIFPNGLRRDLRWHTTYTILLGETVAFVICGPIGAQEVWTLMDEVEDSGSLHGSEFKFLGIWMNRNLYGCKINWDREISFLSYNADSGRYSHVMVPFAKDGISPQLLINHAGCLISPSKIVKEARKQSSNVTLKLLSEITHASSI